MNRIEQLIEKYHLHPHPEGGHFAEVYTAPYLYQENRECAGSIYFMLVKNDISHFHVIDCDEIWYFHEGCGMKITMIDEDGNVTSQDLGMKDSEEAMVVIPKGVMFAAENLSQDSYTFVSCVTTPQFQYSGFRLVKYPVILLISIIYLWMMHKLIKLFYRRTLRPFFNIMNTEEANVYEICNYKCKIIKWTQRYACRRRKVYLCK